MAAAAQRERRGRRLGELHPDLERLSVPVYLEKLARLPSHAAVLETRLERLRRLREIDEGSRVLVVGCGPRPETLLLLSRHGYQAVGVEINPTFAQFAREFVQNEARVLDGEAERLPCDDEAFDVVFCDNVLEHATSVSRALAEMHRLLVPGGIAHIVTTNRQRLSPTGRNGEFKVAYFNWLPATVRESFVFQHLHYAPGLANYAVRPAVHWFTYAELCALGREAGFERFYSPLDLSEPTDAPIKRNPVKRRLLKGIKRSPWLRALALTQVGGTVVMVKPSYPMASRGVP